MIEPTESSFRKYCDPKTHAPWLYDGANFWTYDDPDSWAFKAQYVRQQQLGGVMIWDLSGDMPDGVLIQTLAKTIDEHHPEHGC